MRAAVRAVAVGVALGACSSSPLGPAAPAAPGSDGAATSVPTTTAAPTTTTAPPPPCPTLGADLDRLVRRFRTAAGSCLPAGAAATYRCSPTAPVPVAIVGGRRFLGGSHATPAEGPPPAASLVGTAEDGFSIVADPADPGAVFLAGPAGVERWPAVPVQVDANGAAVEGSARLAVFVVGDSVVLGAEPQLRAAFGGWALTLDAAVSRFTREGIDVLRTRRAEVADIAVVALGYNDGIDVEPFRAVAGALLDELAGLPLVVWINLRATQPYYAADNVVLAELAAARPNVVVADWATASAALPPEEFAADGLHLGPVAAQAMADLVSTTVATWFHRHPDQGDRSCRPALDAAVAAGQ